MLIVALLGHAVSLQHQLAQAWVALHHIQWRLILITFYQRIRYEARPRV